MSQQITIEKNKPMPERRPPLPPLPLDEMEIGHSFKLKLESMVTDKATIRQRLSRFQRANPPKQFSMKQGPDEELDIAEDEVRIGRIEDAGT